MGIQISGYIDMQAYRWRVSDQPYMATRAFKGSNVVGFGCGSEGPRVPATTGVL